MRPSRLQLEQDAFVQAPLANLRHDEGLKHEAHIVQLADLAQVGLPDAVALPRLLLNQPPVGQHLEGLAHGLRLTLNSAHKASSVKTVSRQVAPMQDSFAQAVEDRLAEVRLGHCSVSRLFSSAPVAAGRRRGSLSDCCAARPIDDRRGARLDFNPATRRWRRPPRRSGPALSGPQKAESPAAPQPWPRATSSSDRRREQPPFRARCRRTIHPC